MMLGKLVLSSKGKNYKLISKDIGIVRFFGKFPSWLLFPSFISKCIPIEQKNTTKLLPLS